MKHAVCTKNGKTSGRLTAEQRELVERNVAMVYRIAYDMVNTGFMPENETEDAVQNGMLGLTKAALTFDAELGYTFSTYAYACIRRELYYMKRREKRHGNTYSLDIPQNTRDRGKEDRTLGDTLVADDDTEAEALEAETEKLWRKLETCGMGRHAEALRRNIEGETFQQIGNSMGITKQRASQMARLAKEQLRRMMIETSY